EIPTASPDIVARHYGQRLAFETDCSDVFLSMQSGEPDFVLLDVRGPALFATSHIPGAVNLPHGKMTARKMAEWPD
ncbi:rhodanese-like domain-containing protein, partial [Enterobacter hormaechei]|uniref:rhodanese-like domain-containing protein n=1 Tax=Enterobacter hormaechei TaxID=158836 RepID=UPI0023B81E9B